MLRITPWFGILFFAGSLIAAEPPGEIGARLPPWTPGMLDIHQIATGRGNAALFILPDGTTLLVDAGAAGDGIPETDPHPDASRSPGAWIIRYLRRHGVTELDYALITHFHPDHFGQLRTSSPPDSTGAYRLTGITEVGSEIPIHTLIDRGWPDYSYPMPIESETMANYRRFLAVRQKSGIIVERFKPGSSTQIKLLHQARSFPQFEIRNIIANGEVWTGAGHSTRRLFPALETLTSGDLPSENECSLGFRLRYGHFRYFTGGDLPGLPDPGFPAWHGTESAVGPLIGPVDVTP